MQSTEGEGEGACTRAKVRTRSKSKRELDAAPEARNVLAHGARDSYLCTRAGLHMKRAIYTTAYNILQHHPESANTSETQAGNSTYISTDSHHLRKHTQACCQVQVCGKIMTAWHIKRTEPDNRASATRNARQRARDARAHTSSRFCRRGR